MLETKHKRPTKNEA